MKPTRQRILDYLASHTSATAAELSRALQVTPSDVRYHLGILVHEGTIVPTGERLSQGRGRPAQRYRLASQGREGKFDLLASALLDESLTGLSLPRQETFRRPPPPAAPPPPPPPPPSAAPLSSPPPPPPPRGGAQGRGSLRKPFDEKKS